MVMDLFSPIFGKTRSGFSELLMFFVPLWTAFSIGVVVGWVWRPRLVNLIIQLLKVSASSQQNPILSVSPSKSRIPESNNSREINSIPAIDTYCSSSEVGKETDNHVTEEDLEHIWRLAEVKDGGPAWTQMMDRSTPTMTYQAWRRDPETGPPQYRSRTVFEDADPELVRDFFWDDEFRLKWDDMLIHASTLEECQTTGTMVVRWVRKFPFFCSDREYVIGRRIWQLRDVYYCVTKGVPYPSLQRHKKPRRVDLYYSSWCIRAVESSKRDGRLSACEVSLFHHEDMGIPWEIAKLGVRQGMWGAVKKIEPGFRAYQKHRASGAPISHCAFLADINTKVSDDYWKSLEGIDVVDTSYNDGNSDKPLRKNISKIMVVCGAMLLVFSLDRGLLTKAAIFGVARRFATIGRRLR